jgi:hypothetical protein
VADVTNSFVKSTLPDHRCEDFSSTCASTPIITMAVGLLGVLTPLTAILLWTRLLPPSLPYLEALPASAVSDYLLSGDKRIDNDFSSAQLALSKFTPPQTTAANQTRRHLGITVTTVSTNQYLSIVNILIAGDINPNPGPIQCPCGACGKPVTSNQRAICCDGEGCDKWYHIKCTGTSIAEYNHLSECDTDWYCAPCTLPQFTDSFFDLSTESASVLDDTMYDTNSSTIDISPGRDNNSADQTEDNAPDLFHELRERRKRNYRQFQIGHLNINSFRYKSSEIIELLTDNVVDLLFISETKLDASFVDAQFSVPGYRLWRADRTSHGGGVLAYLRSDIPGCRRTDLEFCDVESVAIEDNLSTAKWLIYGVYRPPSMPNGTVTDDMCRTLDKASTKFDSMMLVGDMNYNFKKSDDSHTLVDICDVFDLVNIVKEPTCFTKGAEPTLIDVILTNRADSCCNMCNFNCGISDCHNFVSVQIRGKTPHRCNATCTYRSFREFDRQSFVDDLERAPFHIAEVFDDVNDSYWAHEQMFLEVVDRHAPVKIRKPRKHSAPFMNSKLRKAVHKKRMLHNRYIKHHSGSNWEAYRVQRNVVTKLRRESIKNYFLERCSGGPNSKDFWPTIKPFLTNKGLRSDATITLCNDDKIVTDQREVGELFNSHYVNIASDIGSGRSIDPESHPSILAISTNNGIHPFKFRKTTTKFVSEQIDKIGLRKATGVDGISPKLIRLAKPALVGPLTDLINMSISSGTFPDRLKEAQVTPVFKKNDPLDKVNYRPVSVLTVSSKIFERAINDQLYDHFTGIYHPFLAAFRKNYGCQTTLLRALEDWRKALDENKYVAAILMDLSKAFDCLPHNLLLAKLKAYGLDDKALGLIQSYLNSRRQCVKIGSSTSSWQELTKGVPQGSILGPLLFNVFLNDIFTTVRDCDLYNYADDNTLSHAHKDIDVLKATLESDASRLIEWFDANLMKANPDKFQAIAFGKKTNDLNLSFNIGQFTLPCEESVKLLGVTLDFKLSFNDHIAELCKKTSRQLNVLKRIGRHLSTQCKLLIYHSFILSNFNYCSLTWHFCNERSTQKMERIQERALRFIYNDYLSPYITLLENSKFPALHVRRLKVMAIEAYKIFHRQGPTLLHDLLVPKTSKYSFRYDNIVNVPHVRTTTYGLKSFRYSAAKLWNELPNSFRTASSFGQYRNFMDNWNGLSCKCSACK